MKTVKQYLLYVLNDKGEQSKDGNWNIEKYDLWHDLQDRETALELQGIPTKVFIEFTNGTIEEDRIVA